MLHLRLIKTFNVSLSQPAIPSTLFIAIKHNFVIIRKMIISLAFHLMLLCVRATTTNQSDSKSACWCSFVPFQFPTISRENLFIFRRWKQRKLLFIPKRIHESLLWGHQLDINTSNIKTISTWKKPRGWSALVCIELKQYKQNSS